MNSMMIFFVWVIVSQDANKIEKIQDQNDTTCNCIDDDEMKILTMLRKKRLELDEKEADLKKREEDIEENKKKVDQKIEELRKRVTILEAAMKIGQGAQEEKEKRMASLIETFTSLSAKKVAPMLSASDPDLVRDLLIRMGPEKSAALMVLMPTEKAAEIINKVGNYHVGKSASSKKDNKKNTSKKDKK